MTTRSPHVLVLDFHAEDPPFAAPRWFPEACTHQRVLAARGDALPTLDGFTHLVLSGSACSIVDDPDFVAACEELLHQAGGAQLPMFGVCYGSQLIVRALLGRSHVRRNPRGVEAGWLATEVIDEHGGWFEGLPRPFHVWHYHLDEVFDLPSDWRVLASTPLCPTQAWVNDRRRLLGVQFHPEMPVDEGNYNFAKDRDSLARRGIDADALIAQTRDDGARALFARFLARRW